MNINHEHNHPNKDPQSLFGFNWNNPVKANVSGCALAPESIYGPYWIEGQQERQDIRAGRKGIYTRLALQVIDVNTCMPVNGARVDVWHVSLLISEC